MNAVAFAILVATCAPHVDLVTARAVVTTESGFNPYAIGVVGGSLARQPRNPDEALLVLRRLRSNGFDYSVGLSQINSRNFDRLALTDAKALEPCRNLSAMQVVLDDCYERATRTTPKPQQALRMALSCYYSGDFVTGFAHGYVWRVARAAASGARYRHPLSSRPTMEST